MKSRAQTGLEVSLVAGFILFFIILVISAYVDVGDTTVAMAILKENSISALQQDSHFHFISDMNFEILPNGELHMVVAVQPKNTPLDASVKNQIETTISPKIAAKTRFSAVSVEVNE